MTNQWIKGALLAAGITLMLPNVAVAAASTSASSNNKIAIVNLVEIMQTSPEAKAIREKLEKEFKGRQEELTALQQKLQKDMEQYQRDQAVMGEKEKQALAGTIQQQQQDLQKKQYEGQQDYSRRDQEETQAFLMKVKAAVEAIAKKKQYQMILRSDMVAFSAEGLDITQDVMKTYREQNKS